MSKIAAASRARTDNGAGLIGRVEDMLASAQLPAPEAPSTLESARAALDSAIVHLMQTVREAPRARPTTMRGRCQLVIDLAEIRRELDDELTARRLRALTNVQEALSHLRGVESVSQLLQKATYELCRTCGFERAILSRVDGSRLIAESTYFGDRTEEAAQILRFWNQEPPELTHLLLETEMLRRRAPALVLDAINDPRTHKPLLAATSTQSYVAAPIMPEGRVIGFLHADRLYSGMEVDELDRDTIWTFAEGFGYAVERTILLERLQSQRKQVRQQLMSIEAILNELCEAEVEIAHVSEESDDVARAAAAMFVAPESRLDSLLTRRELEVLELLADGATNAMIADRLVISEGTVKSHVKHILRKLRAANRAEAVSRYLRLRARMPSRG